MIDGDVDEFPVTVVYRPPPVGRVAMGDGFCAACTASVADVGSTVRCVSCPLAVDLDELIGRRLEPGRPFVADCYDPDAEFVVGGALLGSGAIVPEAAVSTAFANFPWVAVHAPNDDVAVLCYDWDTWLVYLELDGPLPKVVGVQRTPLGERVLSERKGQ